MLSLALPADVAYQLTSQLLLSHLAKAASHSIATNTTIPYPYRRHSGSIVLVPETAFHRESNIVDTEDSGPFVVATVPRPKTPIKKPRASRLQPASPEPRKIGNLFWSKESIPTRPLLSLLSARLCFWFLPARLSRVSNRGAGEPFVRRRVCCHVAGIQLYHVVASPHDIHDLNYFGIPSFANTSIKTLQLMLASHNTVNAVLKEFFN